MGGVKKARSHGLKLRGLVTRLKKVLQSEYAESVEVYRSWEGAFEGDRAERIFFGPGLRT